MAPTHAQEQTSSEVQADTGVEEATELSDMEVVEDPFRALPNESSGSSFGFTKPLVETPRSVSFISEEQITLLGINTADDLTRAVPGTYTTTRYGLQGGINVRGVAADIYFRGMKRLSMQGHARTSLAAMDTIEVVKGPPSPIYGMGKIGGYTNLVPKSARAKVGTYLEDAVGFATATSGSYERAEATVGTGGPMSVLGKSGGYYVFGLLEDSDTYVEQVEAKQKILQATFSVDNFFGPFRLETGGQWQNSQTSGAYMNRVTQALIDNGTYVRGLPLVQLDGNRDGQVGFLETHLYSPINTLIRPARSGNQPLRQDFPWPTDPVTGAPLDIPDWPTIPGVPQSMLDYLNAHPELDCEAANIMRSMPAGGPQPLSGWLPVGMVLDPCTTGYDKVNRRRNGAYEQLQDAVLMVGYIDLIYDTNPDFTIKNQLFYDMMDTFKDSRLPYGEEQLIYAIEDKVTLTKTLGQGTLPSWLRVNSLASINYRMTHTSIESSGGDWDHRQDVMSGERGYLIPNTRFWNQIVNDSYETGAPQTRNARSEYWESGVGVMFDITVFGKTNLVLGGRYDFSEADSADLERFDETEGFVADPDTGFAVIDPDTGLPMVGAYLPKATANGEDDGASWSVSLSHELPFGIRPYVTFARSTIQLASSNDLISRSIATTGHLGEAELKEGGIKANLFGGRLFLSGAYYEQVRTDISTPDDPTVGAYASSTEGKGFELEAKWVPGRKGYISAYATFTEAQYLFNTNDTYELFGDALGFADVVSPTTGEVLYPADAYVLGGRARVSIPTEILEKYKDTGGFPETTFGINAYYQVTQRLGVLLGGTYFSDYYTNRLQTILLPEVFLVNAAITYDIGQWNLKLNGYNITDEEYWNGSRNLLVSQMPEVRWELTARINF
jgi:outer membrane receptor protein involved in Fe transport